MANFTKKVIRDSFLKLLEEKPLKQISVRDIVNECGVNRNTFYYHFQDIPQLLESIIQEDADDLIRRYPTIRSAEECLNALIEFSLAHRKSVLHIYRSVSRDIFEQYQWRVCAHAATTYIDSILVNRNVSAADRQLLIEYVKCVSFGLVNGWLESGMRDDIHDFTHRLCTLKQGDLEEMIDRCENN